MLEQSSRTPETVSDRLGSLTHAGTYNWYQLPRQLSLAGHGLLISKHC